MKFIRGLLCICVIAAISLTARAGTLKFVSNDLELDLAKSPFGSSLESYSNAVKSRSGEGWYQTEASFAYEKQHPQSHLEFEFSNGKLSAIRISTFPFSTTNQETNAKFKAALDKVYADFRQLDGKGNFRQDNDLRISYQGMCYTEENLAAIIEITLPNYDPATPNPPDQHPPSTSPLPAARVTE
jgi:hypothetical protein